MMPASANEQPATVPSVMRRSSTETLLVVAREHGLALAVVGTQLAVGAAAGMLGTKSQETRGILASGYVWSLLKIALAWLPVLCGLVAWRAWRLGPANWAGIWRLFATQYLTAKAALGALVGVLLIAHSAAVHDMWKSTLGILAPYTWDARLYRIDRALHFGHDPWQLLSPLSGPTAVRVIDVLYASWYPMVSVVSCWIVWTHHRKLRSRALVAWMLQWAVLGAMAAHFFASGGPAFYRYLVPGPDPYADLIVRLQSADAHTPLHAVFMQQSIWDNVARGAGRPWLFMSAMPSIHVAMSALFALILGQVNRQLKIGMWLYTVAILMGSVALGWHYAVDGYVAIAGIAMIWWLSGILTHSGGRKTGCG